MNGTKARMEEIRKYIVRHQDIADLGIGRGQYYARIDFNNVTGVDLDGDNIERIKRDFPKINMVRADVRETGLPDKSYDLVVISQVLEHFEDYQPILKEAKRICQNDGYFLIGTPIEMYEEKHFHPVWKFEDVKALGNLMGEIVEMKKLENSWLIYIKNA